MVFNFLLPHLLKEEDGGGTPSLISDNSKTTYYQTLSYALSSFTGTGLLSSVSYSVILSNGDKLYSSALGYTSDNYTAYNITNILDSNGTAFTTADGNYPTEVSGPTSLVIIYEFATPKTITEVQALVPNREIHISYTFTTCSIETASSTDSTYTSQGSLSGHNSATENSVGTLTLSSNNTNIKYVKYTFVNNGISAIGVGEILIYGFSGGGGGAPTLTISGGTAGTDYKTYTTSNNQLYVVFLSPNTYSITSTSTNAYNYEYFVVGGGGAGGGGGGGGTFSASALANTGGGSGGNGSHGTGGGGGGGGGGAVMEGTITKNAGTINVIVGKGQTLKSDYSNFIDINSINPATNSSFDTIIAGNGGAGEYNPYHSDTISHADYSGGGGGGGGSSDGRPSVGGISDNGFNGGNGKYQSPAYPGGGGGGAGQAGTNATSGSTAGVGGDGKKPTQQNIIDAITYWNTTTPPTPIGQLDSNEYWFGGGGGGGSFDPTHLGGAGGKGGGTQGSPGGITTPGLGGSGVVVLVVTL